MRMRRWTSIKSRSERSTLTRRQLVGKMTMKRKIFPRRMNLMKNMVKTSSKNMTKNEDILRREPEQMN